MFLILYGNKFRFIAFSGKAENQKKKCNYHTTINIRQDHINDYFNAEFAFALVPDLSPNHVFCYFTEISIIPVTMAVAVSIY